MIKKCTMCKINDRKNEGKDRACLKCHSEYMKKWRKTHPLNKEQKERDIARSYAFVYLSKGKIERKNCEVCGEKAQMHHNDYKKPLEVQWLCRKHHLDLHSKNKIIKQV